MIIEITLPVNDYDIVELHEEFLKKELIDFRLIDNHFEIVNPEHCEGDPMNLEFIEVKLSVQSYNNLWAIAKMVQNFKLTGEFTI